MTSPLLGASTLAPKSYSKRGKKMVAVVMLTSLVDAFTIMLLYLLMQPSGNGSTLEVNKTDHLPTAVKTDVVNNGTIVRVEGKHYFLNQQEVTGEGLAQKLQEIKATFGSRTDEDSRSLIIQADREVDFAELTPIVRAGSVSGFNKFKFAVLQDEGAQ
jgi:biopolymer transport protein ExbD